MVLPSWISAALAHVRRNEVSNAIMGWRKAGLLDVWGPDLVKARDILCDACIFKEQGKLWPAKDGEGAEEGAGTGQRSTVFLPEGVEGPLSGDDDEEEEAAVDSEQGPAAVVGEEAKEEQEGEGGETTASAAANLAEISRVMREALDRDTAVAEECLPAAPRLEDEGVEELEKAIIVGTEAAEQYVQANGGRRTKKGRGGGRRGGAARKKSRKTQVTDAQAGLVGQAWRDEGTGDTWVVAMVAWYRTAGHHVAYCYIKEDYPQGLPLEKLADDNKKKAWIKRKLTRFPTDDVQEWVDETSDLVADSEGAPGEEDGEEGSDAGGNPNDDGEEDEGLSDGPRRGGSRNTGYSSEDDSEDYEGESDGRDYGSEYDSPASRE